VTNSSYKIYTCDGTAWSGNLLNWATMTAIDIFRATLTGGNRALGTGGWSTSSGNTTAATLVSDYSAGDSTYHHLFASLCRGARSEPGL
jgi:type IV pilus assembly protein PilY1